MLHRCTRPSHAQPVASNRVAALKLEPNIASPDEFYEVLLDAHRGLTMEQSQRLNARLILILANHVGGPLPDHNRRRIGITPYHRGHDRGIRNSQAVDALDPQTGVDHRHRIALWAHLAGSDRVVLSISTIANILFHTGGIVDPCWVQHLAAH